MKDSLFYSLHKLVFITDRQSDEVLHHHFGFGFSQFKILIAAKHRAGLTQGDIANFLGQTEASVSRQLKIMKKQGLIKAKPAEANRRKHSVMLTDKGLELLAQASSVIDAAHASTFGSLGYKEQELMKQLVERLTTKAGLKK